MLTRERAEQIFKQVLKFSTADETEAMMSSTSYSLTRFANNTIHQNVQEEGSYLSVRAVAGQRTARASTNRFDETSIRQAAEAALELARTQPPDPDLLPMPAPQTYRAVNRSYGETAELNRKNSDCARRKGPAHGGGDFFERRLCLRAVQLARARRLPRRNALGVFCDHARPD